MVAVVANSRASFIKINSIKIFLVLTEISIEVIIISKHQHQQWKTTTMQATTMGLPEQTAQAPATLLTQTWTRSLIPYDKMIVLSQSGL